MLSASIAQVPIATDLSHLPQPRRVDLAETVQIRPELNLTDRLPQQQTINKRQAGGEPETAEPQSPQPAQAQPEEDPPLPPGAMFAAAIIAGQLSPKPESMEEVFLRAGVSWTPPDSEFRLADKLV